VRRFLPASVRHHRVTKSALAVALGAGLIVAPVALVLVDSAPASADTSYTPAAPTLATITSPAGCSGSTCAPWNESQGDPSSPTYASQSPGTVLPTYTPGGATTGSGASAEPNLAVYPGANSGTTAGNTPYPSGVVGTPGPLDGYCGTGNEATESAGSPARQPAGSTLPLAPAYFPHVVSNADGSLTGYFDYRPKDADEALVVARSTDGGHSWTYEGEALEQDPNYCPSADTNDDGEGHANVITAGGVSRLYTLERAAGDSIGVGMLVHSLAGATAADPLNGVPATEKTGVDPDAFVPTGTATSAITHTTAATITVNSTGTADSTEQLVAGGFVDLTQNPTPTASAVIICTAVTATTLTGCTSPSGTTINVAAGDQVEQVIGYVSGATTVPTGPNNSLGTGGIGTINVITTPTGSTKGFTNALTGTTYNNNAPNRAYIDGVAVYCSQGNANPTTKMEDCTTGTGASALSAATGDPITSDPIIPTSAAVTSGLVSPDGIVGTLPSYPNDGTVPAGATYVMYTEKELNYFVAGTTTNSSSTTFGSTAFSLTFTPSPYESADMPSTVSAGSPVTVEMGDNTTSTTFVPVTCTGLTTGATDSLTGCTVPTADQSDKYASTSLIGAPGATTESPATLALTGEGSTSAAKLYKNNEDLTVLRVAWTTDGVNFSTTGLANGGVISGNNTGGSTYNDITNPSTTSDPSGGLNAYATAGTTDATEMRWVGSAGSIITNPDGSFGLFLSGAWSGDGDSDAFNQIFYAQSTDGEHWTVPKTVVSTDYTFSASIAQDTALASGSDQPLGISAYYEGRAYGPSVIQNPNGTLTMVFAGYRLPKTISSAGTAVGTGSPQWTVGATDPALYRNILTVTLDSSTSPGVDTQTTVASSPAAPLTGQPVTLTATVSVPSPGSGIPTGTVSFSGNGGSLCTGTLSDTVPDTASCVTTYTSPQSDTVTATYGADANYATSSGSTPVTIGSNATTTVLASSANPSVTGQPVTYTATVSVNPPGTGEATGTVTFDDNGSPIATSPACSGTLSGASPPAATCTVSEPTTGTHSITASYGGDGDNTGSSASAVAQVVDAAATTTSFDFSPPAPVAGQPVTFTATVAATPPGTGNPTGSVSFSGGAGVLCTGSLSGTSTDTASCSATYSAQTMDAVTATYGGNDSYSGSSSPSRSISVGQADTTTVITSSANPSVNGQPVTFTATVSPTAPAQGTPTGSVTFALSDPVPTKGPGHLAALACAGGSNTVTLSGGTAQCALPAGLVLAQSPATVHASYAGSASYQASTATPLVQTVGKAATAVAISAKANPTVTSKPANFTAFVTAAAPGTGFPTGVVTWTITGTSGGPVTCKAGNSTVNKKTGKVTCNVGAGQLTAANGPYTVVVSYPGDASFAASVGTFTQTITPTGSRTKIAVTPPTASGAPGTVTATVVGVPAAAGTPTGSVTFSVVSLSGVAVSCDGGNTVALNFGVASCVISSALVLAGSPYSVTATYGGDANFTTSTSNPKALRVPKG
jgi:large repetitive protein